MLVITAIVIITSFIRIKVHPLGTFKCDDDLKQVSRSLINYSKHLLIEIIKNTKLCLNITESFYLCLTSHCTMNKRNCALQK